MQKILILISFLFLSLKSYSQIENVEVLIGKTESYVRYYLDSLSKLKNNPYVKVKNSISDDGDVILEIEFALKDESFYKCTSIHTRFFRASGEEYCKMQVVQGSVEYAKHNLDFIKDNYVQSKTSNKWELSIGMLFKVVAIFERLNKFYSIVYQLEENK